MTKNKRKSMPYKRQEDGTIDSGMDGRPVLGEDKLDDPDSTDNGTRRYWENFLSFGQAIYNESMDNDQNVNSLQEIKKGRSTEITGGVDTNCTSRTGPRHLCTPKRRKQKSKRANFKENVIFAGLCMQQQNTAVFQSFVAVFCAANNQVAPPPLDIPGLPDALV